MVNQNDRYFYISGFISFSLFLAVGLLFGIMLINSLKPLEEITGRYDLVLANILAAENIRLVD